MYLLHLVYFLNILNTVRKVYQQKADKPEIEPLTFAHNIALLILLV